MTSTSVHDLRVRTLLGRPQSAADGAGTSPGAGLAIAVYFFTLPRRTSSRVCSSSIVLSCRRSAILFGARRKPRLQRLPWYLFAAGMLCQVIADAISRYYEIHLNMEPPSAFGGRRLLPQRVPAARARDRVADPRGWAGMRVVRRCSTRSSSRSRSRRVQWIFFVEAYVSDRSYSSVLAPASRTWPIRRWTCFCSSRSRSSLGPGGRTAAYRLLLLSGCALARRRTRSTA